MNILTSDFEITTWNTGSPFDQRNFPVCLGYKVNDFPTECTFECEGINFYPKELYVFFNAKYDLHWYRKLGVDIGSWKIWCCQVAEYVLSGQTLRWPSLENTAVKYNLGHKVDVVKLEYWDKGINTDEVPRDILSTYCTQDVDLTYAIYLKQLEQFEANPALYQTFKLKMLDLLVLEEIEWNGQKYNEELCNERAQNIEAQIASLTEKLTSVYPDVPINFNSGDQLSAFLYGGTITEEYKEHVGFYKTGIKAGQPKYSNRERQHQLPRLVEPIRGSALKKAGFFATDVATLKKLKGPAARKYVEPLLKLSALGQILSNTYRGIPEINREQYWEEGMIHPQFNQVVTATTRLSSSKPNGQNFASETLDIFITRYNE